MSPIGRKRLDGEAPSEQDTGRYLALIKVCLIQRYLTRSYSDIILKV